MKRVDRRHGEAKEMDKKQLSYNKRYSDKRRHAKKSSIRIRDTILIRQEKRNKLTANLNSQPYTVISRRKGEIKATNKRGHTVTRNVSNCKQIPRTTHQRVVVDRMILKITAYQPRKLRQAVPETKMVALIKTYLQKDQRGVGKGLTDMDIIFCHELFLFKV